MGCEPFYGKPDTPELQYIKTVGVLNNALSALVVTKLRLF